MNPTPNTIQTENFEWLGSLCHAPRLRTMREFAEAEIVIPSGPYAGLHYRCDKQPYSGLWFDSIDSGLWRRFAATGPTQTGKTLTCTLIPLMYHLFEIGEDVIFGVPDKNMVEDKWKDDILPIIQASRYRDLIPSSGAGSRGGQPSRIEFGNGASLRFMTGGGGDKARAGKTARVLIVTEADGFDIAGDASKEADPISQLEVRTRAYGDLARIYLECTVTFELGRIWREYTGGTQSAIMMPCRHCNAHVILSRDHLLGWQDAKDVIDARNKAHFVCSQCGHAWTEKDRIQAAHKSILVHSGQSIQNGEVKGKIKSTDTLGFRWSAPDNLLMTAADIGADEWRGKQERDTENAERKLNQFVWAIPVKPDKVELFDLTETSLLNRLGHTGRGYVPRETLCISVGLDVGKFVAHWFAIAIYGNINNCSIQELDYGQLDVPSRSMDPDIALDNMLYQFKEIVMTGFPAEDTGELIKPSIVGIDAGWSTDLIYAFCREHRAPFIPFKGFGLSQTQLRGSYHEPKQRGDVVQWIGKQCHISLLKDKNIYLLEANADYWKSYLHDRLIAPVDGPGALTLHNTDKPVEHYTLVKHLTSERQVEEFIPGRGPVVKWERVGQRSNHFLDAAYMACCVGNYGLERVSHKPAPKADVGSIAPKKTNWTIGR